ncbi:AAA family ATPase [Thalassoglobus polymorphus]|uniref:ATPase family associated with various cellular activities (AAA) n=1 Tax=Thalassoglobus polymorphus TaxID=2527994 RepID=A0A517QRD6_9PLAN|nr:MoxR family ATPase [Thalassoglobus polymorphus]QDT34191.1 ATPase family associated with various cellular activities (AAA) [Thalassoglobus polymorphus]
MELERVKILFDECLEEIGKVFVGQVELVEGALIALFSEGSVLIEGVPGLGKTLLVNTLSKVVSCEFGRVQFTPDLMPSDLTGHNVYSMKDQQFHFIKGPVFTNLMLADEVNRSPPKTQSALLEVMEEKQVTVDGETRRLPRPFLVLATQNPLEHEGTYPLPEAQVDRFMFKLMIDYPPVADEKRILGHYASGKNPHHHLGYDLKPVMASTDVLEIQKVASQVIVEEKVINYIVEIIDRTRNWHSVSVGASPRGGVNMLVAGRTLAACRGRDFVTPDDIKEIAPWVLRHRLLLRPDIEIEGTTVDDVILEIMDNVEVPRS